MNDNSIDEIKSTISRIEKEIILIRKLFVGAICIAVFVIAPALAVALAFLWILWLLIDAMFRRAERKRIERQRFQELSGRTVKHHSQNLPGSDPEPSVE